MDRSKQITKRFQCFIHETMAASRPKSLPDRRWRRFYMPRSFGKMWAVHCQAMTRVSRGRMCLTPAAVIIVYCCIRNPFDRLSAVTVPPRVTIARLSAAVVCTCAEPRIGWQPASVFSLRYRRHFIKVFQFVAHFDRKRSTPLTVFSSDAYSWEARRDQCHQLNRIR